MIDKATAAAVLQEAKKTGGDFAELFLEDKDALSFSMVDGTLENASAVRDYGAGVRILRGTRSVYAYSNDTSAAALLDTARQAAAALEGNGAASDIVFAGKKHVVINPIAIYPGTVPHQDKLAVMRSAFSAAKSVSAEISQVVVNYADIDQRVHVINSEGLWAEDRRVRTRIIVQTVASSGTEFQTGHEGPGLSMGFELFKTAVNAEDIARRAANTAVAMLHAVECPAAHVPVVIDGGFGGVIFHEACGHSLEATSVAKGDSVFCGKLNQKIAAECVSAYDDGTIPNRWGSVSMDDEGSATTRNLLIENGILRGYMIDRLGARRLNMEATGSGRRQGYAYAPTSRMTNTFIAAGSDDEEEMIRTMGEGLYAKKMGGGSVNPLTGEFNFAVLEGCWIKNGERIPVRGATLIGKGADVLMTIDRVGKNVTMDAGMCGSVSGSVPTSVGQPRIRISGITIGGKGGARL